MDTRWDPPPFPSTAPADEARGTRRAAGRNAEVARVVLHADGQDVWIDAVQDKAIPSIQVVSAREVARTALVCGWCWTRGHRIADLQVLEGTLVKTGRAPVTNDPGTTVRVTQTDGVSHQYVLEARTRTGCTRCGAIDRDRPERAAEPARLPASAEVLPPVSPAVPVWRQWPRMPWKPHGPIRGLHFSFLAPLAIVTALVMTRLPELPFAGWLPLTLVLIVGGDIVVSTVAARVRLFLEACGARFDLAHPFGDRPVARPVVAEGMPT